MYIPCDRYGKTDTPLNQGIKFFYDDHSATWH